MHVTFPITDRQSYTKGQFIYQVDHLKRWQSDHTCHHPHRFNVKKCKKWNGNSRLVCVNVQHPLSKVWGCTVLDKPETSEMAEQIDCQTKRPPQATSVSKDLKCYRAKDATCRHCLEERHGEQGSAWQSLKGWGSTIINQINIGTVLKATFGTTSERGVKQIWAFLNA